MTVRRCCSLRDSHAIAFGRGTGSSRFRLNCTIRLLLHRPRSAPQGVDEGAGEQEIRKSEAQELYRRAWRVGSGLRCLDTGGDGYGPVGWDQETASIRQNDDEVRSATALPAAEDLKNTALERMMAANNSDEPRDVMDLGSVEWLPSTESSTID
jgi:hypothetical protein